VHEPNVNQANSCCAEGNGTKQASAASQVSRAHPISISQAENCGAKCSSKLDDRDLSNMPSAAQKRQCQRDEPKLSSRKDSASQNPAGNVYDEYLSRKRPASPSEAIPITPKHKGSPGCSLASSASSCSSSSPNKGVHHACSFNCRCCLLLVINVQAQGL
jgi:hypothetical protein